MNRVTGENFYDNDKCIMIILPSLIYYIDFYASMIACDNEQLYSINLTLGCFSLLILFLMKVAVVVMMMVMSLGL